MKKVAVIVAGGNGSRMNSSIPKQFLLIHGKPILYYSICTFFKAYDDIEIVLVLPENFINKGQEIITTYFQDKKNIKITAGGNTRFHSVQNGLKYVDDGSVVFVHDAVRCLLSKDLIIRTYEATIKYGSAIPVVASKDSLRIEEGNYLKVIDRNVVKLIQTPQVFLSNSILSAFKSEYSESFTDEATVVEYTGVKLHFLDGEENNIKITTPIDLKIAEMIISEAV